VLSQNQIILNLGPIFFINFAGNYYPIPDDADHFFDTDGDLDGIDD